MKCDERELNLAQTSYQVNGLPRTAGVTRGYEVEYRPNNDKDFFLISRDKRQKGRLQFCVRDCVSFFTTLNCALAAIKQMCILKLWSYDV